MIVWHVETSAGARFDWARDEEHLRQQMIEYNNDTLNSGEPDDQLPEDASLDEAIEKVEERENFSREEVWGGYVLEGRERDAILAALRYYQSAMNLPLEIEQIANNDHDNPLSPEEIDDLCERLNC